mgnify:CR=1 FL=1
MDSPVTINAFFCSGIRRIRISRYCSAILQLPLLQMRRNTHTIFSIFAFLLPSRKICQLPSADRTDQKTAAASKKGILILLCQGSEVDHHRLHPPFRTIVPFCTFSLLIEKNSPNFKRLSCPVYNLVFPSFPVRNIFSSCANEPLSFVPEPPFAGTEPRTDMLPS